MRIRHLYAISVFVLLVSAPSFGQYSPMGRPVTEADRAEADFSKRVADMHNLERNLKSGKGPAKAARTEPKLSDEERERVKKV